MSTTTSLDIGFSSVKLPAPPSPSWGTPVPGFNEQLLTITNNFRNSLGVKPLEFDDRLLASSNWKSMNMSGFMYMTHDDSPEGWPPNGRAWYDRIYSYYPTSAGIGENIAYGYQTPQDVFHAWISAGPGEGHYDNIVNTGWVGCGFAMVMASNGLIFSTQDFGTAPVSVPVPTPTPTPTPTPVEPSPVVGQTWRRNSNKRLGTIIRVSPNNTVTWKSNTTGGSTVSKPVGQFLSLFTYVRG